MQIQSGVVYFESEVRLQNRWSVTEVSMIIVPVTQCKNSNTSTQSSRRYMQQDVDVRDHSLS